MKVKPIEEELIFVIGDKEREVVEIKKMIGNDMIKVSGIKLWFNINSFQEVHN